MTPVLPPAAADILARLEAAGHRAFLVGGFVRDSLLGIAPGDCDFATSATPGAVAEALAGLRVLPTGLRHGTVTAVGADGRPCEITTFRVDGPYTDRRRPDAVMFTDSLEADLARRDFTVNAMAYHPAHGLRDPFGGLGDLEKRVIRCVGDPRHRFEEDALRILRAARFASTLGFSVASATLAAMRELSPTLAAVSPERVFAELRRALAGPAFGAVFAESGFPLSAVIPELADTVGFAQNTPYHCHTVYTHSIQAVSAAPADLAVRLCLLLHDIGKPRCHTVDAAGVSHFKGHAAVSADMADGILRRLRCETALREEAVALVRLHGSAPALTPRAVGRGLRRHGEARLRRLAAVTEADNAAKSPAVREARRGYADALGALIDRALAEGRVFDRRRLAVDGHDLIALGIRPGPALGRLLGHLLARVSEGELPNERDALLRAARAERCEAEDGEESL